MKLLILIVSCFAFLGLKKKAYTKEFEKGTLSLPVAIRYLGEKPPDSIHTFFKTVLQLKKYKVISMDEVRELVFAQIQGVSMDWLNSGKLSGIDRDNSVKEKLSNEMSKAVSNLTLVKFFSKAGSDGSYFIDSIQWDIKLLPAVDTAIRYKTFIPNSEDQNDPYKVVKKFADSVTGNLQ